jgi:hydrogenase maturation protease
MAAPRIAIAGAGNWLLGHDRIGPAVLACAEGRYGSEVELCDIGAASLALLDHLDAQELLIVVDACIFGGDPGEVVTCEPDLDQEIVRETSVHQIGPVEALIVARHLFPEKLPRRVLLVLVETEGLGEEGEQAACEKVISIIDREVEQWIGSTERSELASNHPLN